MEDYAQKYKRKVSKLEVALKKIHALESHLSKKNDEITEKISIPMKKMTAIKKMLERIVATEIDFSEMKENEINGKFLEIDTLVKDFDVIFIKTLHEIEKIVGKRLVIKNRRTEQDD